jgi:hypothetical protein
MESCLTYTHKIILVLNIMMSNFKIHIKEYVNLINMVTFLLSGVMPFYEMRERCMLHVV